MDAIRTKVVAIKMDDGTVIMVRASTPRGEHDVGLSTKIFSFEPVMTTITSLSRSLHQAFASLRPDRAKAEFGIEFSLETGGLSALVVQTGGVASLTITLEWDRPTDRGEAKAGE